MVHAPHCAIKHAMARAAAREIRVDCRFTVLLEGNILRI
jgi:hypothetical protein